MIVMMMVGIAMMIMMVWRPQGLLPPRRRRYHVKSLMENENGDGSGPGPGSPEAGSAVAVESDVQAAVGRPA